MLREIPPGTAMCRPFSLRAALTLAALACVTILACGTVIFAQSPAPTTPAPTPDTQQAAPAAQAADPAQTPLADPSKPDAHADAPSAAEIQEMAVAEDQLRQQLEGKTFYLRGGYLDNTLHFNEKGELGGNSPKASYTLSLVQIDRVKVDKHHVELEGERYGLHFLGALATQDQSANVDRVKLTSKKKPLKITIDREIVVTPKKPKPEKLEKKKGNDKKAAATAKPAAMAAAQALAASPTTTAEAQQPATAPQTATPATNATAIAPALKDAETSRHGVTITTSQEEANRMLRTALDHIFSPSIDDRMVATLPDYWKLYYKAIADKADYKPSDSAVLRTNQVDTKPRLTMAFEPPSNEYAQKNGVAGMAMYHVIVGPDGKPQEVAIGRPIGFGLDENAVETIRKASFEPGMKDGKAVPVEVDLTVQFRIYSKRTATGTNEAAKFEAASPKAPALPGPYSVNQPNLNQSQ